MSVILYFLGEVQWTKGALVESFKSRGFTEEAAMETATQILKATVTIDAPCPEEAELLSSDVDLNPEDPSAEMAEEAAQAKKRKLNPDVFS